MSWYRMINFCILTGKSFCTARFGEKRVWRENP
jgi:hypothetical protein